jgi:putative FmdB family regulatory protein
MPTYTYQCDGCGFEKDFIRPMAERNDPIKDPHLARGRTQDANDTEREPDCEGTFVRGDNVEVTASTPYAWKP